MGRTTESAAELKPGSVLADREYTAQADRLLQQRLRILTGVAAVASLVFYVVRHLVGVFGGIWGPHLVFDAWAVAHAICVVVLWGLYLALRRRPFPHVFLRAVDVFVFYLGAGTCMIAYVNEYEYGPETSVGLLAVFTVARAVVIPSRAITTFLVSLPIPLGILAIDLSMGTGYFTSGEEMTDVADIVDTRIWKQALLGFGIAVATVASQVNYQLRLALAVSRRVGSYRLEERIGTGALGEVYRATHALLRRPTALKLLRPEVMGEETVRRFEKEVQSASRLTHPNTIRIYDYGRTPSGVFYYTMQYLPGLDLEEIVRRDGPIPAGRVVHVLGQVCRALAEAHGMGLVHRDIKPGNVMLSVLGGESDVVKVLDFGLVKDLRQVEASKTDAGAVCGTPETLSPEVLRGEEPSPLCDIYALGAIGCFLLTGRPIFDASTAAEFMGHHLHTAPVPPSERGFDVPPELEALLLACLEKDPTARPASASELGARLSDLRGRYTWTQEDAAAWWQRCGRTRPSGV